MQKMKYRVGAIFSDVDASFEISHKVVKLFWFAIEEKIPISEIFKEKYSEYTLCFLYSSTTDNQFQIKGPTISKRYKVVEYVIYMPYKEINTDPLKFDRYLYYIEKGISEVLEKYEFEIASLRNIFRDVRNQVINNKEFLE